jgi:hypothetical protein
MPSQFGMLLLSGLLVVLKRETGHDYFQAKSSIKGRGTGK